jgi:hypothetical protein
MFLREDYRDRAIGLIGAFAVLITGVIATNALTAAPVVSTADAVRADNLTDPSDHLETRSDTFC